MAAMLGLPSKATARAVPPTAATASDLVRLGCTKVPFMMGGQSAGRRIGGLCDPGHLKHGRTLREDPSVGFLACVWV